MSFDEAQRRAQRRVGRVLRGKWTLDRLLAVGGMASVYAGTHRNGTRGAIKILHPELAVDAELRSRFLREGYAANSIGHAGVVRAIDDDEEEDTVFLVMELLEGESIEARVARQGRVLPPSEVLALTDQVLDILAAAHDAGVIHRDIKPDNLFLTSTGEVKLLDFGIARISQSSRRSTGTEPGATMGTPVYMAPEQARGRWAEVDCRTDLWSVGATMFSLISGRFVHDAETENEQLLAAMSHRARSLASVAPAAPASVVEVVDRALQYEKESRWQDARVMQHAVRLAYHGLFGKPITTAPRLRVPDEETLVMSRTGLATDGRAPAAFARTTIGRYLHERKRSLVALALAVVVIAAGVFVFVRRSGSASYVPTVSALGPSAVSRQPSSVASVVERSTTGIPVVSPSDLPPAESDTPDTLSKKAPRVPTRTKYIRAETKAPEPDRPDTSTKSSAAQPKPARQGDVLEQQW